MIQSHSQTLSLCPHCFRRVPAQRIVENDRVFLRKKCPEHGALEDVLIWKNNPKPYREWARPHADSFPESPLQLQYGCPYDCGLCLNHKQKTCNAVIEVTHQCNLRCPVCFAASGVACSPDPDREQIVRLLEMVQERSGCCPIQLSGGEPALREDLPAIVSVARKLGFDHIQINTNGLRLAQDADFGQALADAGTATVYLQFDGLSTSIYEHVRGSDILSAKLKAIERCAELKLGLILVPTLVKNVNDHQIGALIQFAKKMMPVVKGIHFQPMTYLGRFPTAPHNDDRMLIPDVLNAIEEQTEGELKFDNFIPSG